ncbi:class I SAM-dependent methyltransferase [Lacticaseibacillus hulanensis]|jgi:2-polyprenyl-3-methyl-5-hydroxy-6-metoxy-1,4-benzoquinol methylase|uniref:class I SAM-dependent methyltransferase n=1 Tax=Lacticaseibacillus hulanensis TaxID=2493111 RepID=UPI000FD94BE3|nr:class I SAM-dependent methyltransferase [Lacticaseibacillus hulanensis]
MANNIYPTMAGADMRQARGETASPQWQQFMHLLPDFAGKNVLVLNCGNGWLCRQVLAKGAIGATGIDADAELITQARKQAGSARLRYRLMPSDYWNDIGGQFDIIVAANVSPSDAMHLATIPRLLRRGHGTLAISGQPEALSVLQQAVHVTDLKPGSWHASPATVLASGNVAIVMYRRRLYKRQ